MKYRWKELDLVSIQTFSNIITFIQFSVIPIQILSSEDENRFEKFKNFLTLNFGPIIKIFTSPFDFISNFYKLSIPIRFTLSSTLIFTMIFFLYIIFFMPSWRLILLLFDVFLPGSFLIGIIFFISNYEEQKKKAIILIVIGTIYMLLRILLFFMPLMNRKKWKWHIKCARLITCVFLERLKKEKNEEELNSIIEDINQQIDKKEKSIQFDTFHFSFKFRIIDSIIAFIIWLVAFVLTIVGWKRILKRDYKGEQLNDLSSVANIITYIFFTGMCIRILVNACWLIKSKEEKTFNIFISLKRFAYKGMYFITNISLIPILKMALLCTQMGGLYCDWNQYYESRSNTNSFLQYFMEREGSYCVNCSKYSAEYVYPCNETCFFDPNVQAYYNWVLIESSFIKVDEFYRSYFAPVYVLEFIYLILFAIIRNIYKQNFDIICLLPAPTKNIECKFQTLLDSLITPTLNVFRSYKFKSAFFSFLFIQSKMFVIFMISLLSLQIIPAEVLQINRETIISTFFSIAGIIISLSHIFSMPYISILHNIINSSSYLLFGIFSFFILMHTSNIIQIPPILGNIFVIIIILNPIITSIITPFFAKRDPLLFPTKFDLLKIQKWDKKLTTIFKFRNERRKALEERKKKKEKDDANSEECDIDFDEDGILLQDEPSISGSYYKHTKKKNEEEEREHDSLVGQFNLIKLAPIQVQLGIENIKYDQDGNVEKSYLSYQEDANMIWGAKDIYEEDFTKATKEMLNLSCKLLDCFSYNCILNLFNFLVIFSSGCLGYCLGRGLVEWKRVLGPNGSDYYTRCNMFANGTYPAFGTY